MSALSLTFTEEALALLRSYVLPTNGHEGAALFLASHCNLHDPWSLNAATRWMCRAVIPIPPEHLISTAGDHVTVSTATFVRTLKRARDENLAIGFVHSHPGGPLWFSQQDDHNDRELRQLATNRNGTNQALLSVIVTADGGLIGRAWTSNHPQELAHIRVVGERFHLHYAERFGSETPAAFHRQALAFGPALNRDLSELRIGIAGAGATGSATAVLLGRLGARRMALFDEDVVDETNLSRLHGATRADIGLPKVDVLKSHIESFGLNAEIRTYRSWIGDRACRDALKACDIVFGCTDDHDGRLLLNRFAYFYLVPVIDMGIDIGLGTDRILSADSRVTTLLPGTRCLLCRQVVDPQAAYEEQLRRRDPNQYQRLQAERYVRGGGNPNPAVVHFTTSVATSAVDELIHRLTGYRRVGSSAHRVRKHHLLEDKRPGAVDNADCPMCGSQENWGRGDVEPFLDRIG